MKKETAGIPKDTSRPSSDDCIKPPHKPELCLTFFEEAGPAGIFKISAYKAYGEMSLPTTISELGHIHGIRIDRELRPHTHQHGGKTHFMWYWLPDLEEATKAVELINQFRQARGAGPLSESTTERLLSAFPVSDPMGVA